ncbi:substrate-binding periplasmic protein [Spartinivicinus poritis]|uniref:Transporter substrate-binding domain-containing protein n=1 Tax=Spartinivicinus poritis TaxID=2994640 RepID=A0ABT5U707_9GAMM|nr:transporter substrate-binding domain-containing protein [Spartinivicinus sp. A2-2]MDE1462153.1 transporter substrate-binding domain-containing protein [Spartinivicinus sp. A2-2]
MISSFVALLSISIGGIPVYADVLIPKRALILYIPDNDGIIVSYSKAVFEELNKRTGINIKIYKLPSEQVLVNANNGNGDGVALRVINIEKQYSNLKRINVPIITVQHVLFVKKLHVANSVNDMTYLNELVVKNKFLVGYLKGSQKAESELAKLSKENKVALNNPMQAFQLLKIGEIDLYLAGPGITSRSILNKYFHRSGIQELGIFSQFPLYPYLHKKHEKLMPLCEKALKSMLDDGTLNKFRMSLELSA